MINPECEFSSAVINASKSHQWTDSLQSHIAGCVRCQETKEMTMMMNTLTAQGSVRALPDYRIIWMKAQYAKRQESLSLLDLIGLVAVALGGLAGLVGLSAGVFPRPFAALTELSRNSLPALKSLFTTNAPLGVMIAVALMVWLLTRDSLYARK